MECEYNFRPALGYRSITQCQAFLLGGCWTCWLQQVTFIFTDICFRHHNLSWCSLYSKVVSGLCPKSMCFMHDWLGFREFGVSVTKSLKLVFFKPLGFNSTLVSGGPFFLAGCYIVKKL